MLVPVTGRRLGTLRRHRRRAAVLAVAPGAPCARGRPTSRRRRRVTPGPLPGRRRRQRARSSTPPTAAAARVSTTSTGPTSRRCSCCATSPTGSRRSRCCWSPRCATPNRASPLRRALPDLHRAPDVERLRLRGWACRGRRASSTRSAATGGSAAQCTTLTGGNPFFVREVARAVVDGTWRPGRPPRTVRDAFASGSTGSTPRPPVRAGGRGRRAAVPARGGRAAMLGVPVAGLPGARRRGGRLGPARPGRRRRAALRPRADPRRRPGRRIPTPDRRRAAPRRRRGARGALGRRARRAPRRAGLAPDGARALRRGRTRPAAGRCAPPTDACAGSPSRRECGSTGRRFGSPPPLARRRPRRVARSSTSAGPRSSPATSAGAWPPPLPPPTWPARQSRPELLAEAALVLEPVPDPATAPCSPAVRRGARPSASLPTRRCGPACSPSRSHLAFYAGDHALTRDAGAAALDLARAARRRPGPRRRAARPPRRRPGPGGARERLALAAEMLAAAERTGDARTAMWGRLWRVDALVEDGPARRRRRRAGSPRGGRRARRGPGQRVAPRPGAGVRRAGPGPLRRGAQAAARALRADAADRAITGDRARSSARSGRSPATSPLRRGACACPHLGRAAAAVPHDGPGLARVPAAARGAPRRGRRPSSDRPGRREAWSWPVFFIAPGSVLAALVAIGLRRADELAAALAALEPFRGEHVVGSGVSYCGPAELTLGLGALAQGRLDDAVADLDDRGPAMRPRRSARASSPRPRTTWPPRWPPGPPPATGTAPAGSPARATGWSRALGMTAFAARHRRAAAPARARRRRPVRPGGRGRRDSSPTA